MQFLVFQIDDHKLALSVELVKRVIPAVAMNSTLVGTDNTLGVINIHGDIVPVIDTRKTLNIRDKEIKPSDQYILCQINNQNIALWVDNTTDIINGKPEESVKNSDTILKNEIITSLIKHENEVIYIYDLNVLLNNKVYGND